MLVSITRARIPAFRHRFAFHVWNYASLAQARRSSGFIAARIASGPGPVFWTLSAWRDARAMHRFRNTGYHRRAMPLMLEWADQMASAHWEARALPSWGEAVARLREDGHTTLLEGGAPTRVVPPQRASTPWMPPRPRT